MNERTRLGEIKGSFPGELTSSRLILRRLRPEDAAVLAGYRSLPEVARYQSWDSFQLEDAVELIAEQQEAEPGVPGTWFQLAIVDRTTGVMMGDCGLHCRDAHQTELGITLAAGYQRRGYAKEALGCALDFIFGRLGADRAVAVTDSENVPAQALFKSLGFRQEGHFKARVWLKGNWGSEFFFALLAPEWERSRSRTVPDK